MKKDPRRPLASGGGCVASADNLPAAGAPQPAPTQRSAATTSPVPIRLPMDVIAWLDQVAVQSGESRSTIARLLLRREMERSTSSRRSTEEQG